MTFKMLLKKFSDQDAWMNFVFPKLQALNPKAKVIFLLEGGHFSEVCALPGKPVVHFGQG